MEARAAHWKLQLNACSFVVKVFVLNCDIVGGWKVYYGFESYGWLLGVSRCTLQSDM